MTEIDCIDFGPDGVGGYPTFEVAAFTGEPVVRLVYATHPDGLGEKGDFWHETRATYLGEDVILPILPASDNRFDTFQITRTGTYSAPLQQGLVRYAKVFLETPGASVKIANLRFENRGTHSEEQPVGSFTCSDGRLDAIWKAGVRTCQLAAIPARRQSLAVRDGNATKILGPSHAYLSDGAKRDRLVWSGDLWWADLNMYYAFAPDSPYMPGSIRMLAENQTPEGYVQACPYPESHGPLKSGDYGPFQSDEFAAWLIPVAYNYHLHTGDDKLMAEILPALERLADYLLAHCREDGIFEQRPETSKNAGALRFGAESTHHRSYMNVLLLGCLNRMAELSPKNSVRYAAAAKKLRAVLANNFAAPGGGLVKSLEDPVLDQEGTALWHALCPADAGPYPAALRKRIWHAKFQAVAIRALFESGLADEAVAAIYEHNWAKILDPAWQGLRTTYECMYLNTREWGDEAHPDTSISGLLSRHLLGVAPTAPGYAHFVFRPPRATSVTHAAGRVPTPHGFIDAAWRIENGTCKADVSVPEGTVCTLLLPDSPPREIHG